MAESAQRRRRGVIGQAGRAALPLLLVFGCAAAVGIVRAAPPPVGPLAFVLIGDDFEGLALLEGDGRIVPLQEEGFAPAWSPDGERLAFTYGSAIFVLRPGQDAVGLVDGHEPRWSPDGNRLAFVRGGDAYIISVADRSVVRLTSAPGDDVDLAWSPDASRLAFTSYRNPQAPHVFVVQAGGGEPTLIAAGALAAWSPDGTQLAITRDGTWLVRADGGEPRRISLRAGRSAWSPDGRHVLLSFDDKLRQPNTCLRCEEAWQSVVAVAVDGTGERSLTAGRFIDAGATWSPGGTRIAFDRRSPNFNDRVVYVMNADGTCETKVADGFDPAWRPGPAPAPLRCAALSLAGSLRSVATTVRPMKLHVIVTNDGTLPATRVRVVERNTPGLHLLSAQSEQGRCAVTTAAVCELGTLRPRASVRIVFAARLFGHRRFITRTVRAIASEADGYEDDNIVLHSVLVYDCTILGDSDPNLLRGTPKADRICGAGASDRLYGGGGNDRIEGGEGEDTILGGPGRDVLLGDGGSDTIIARDGERDVVRCGSESGTAVVDRLDEVRGCRRGNL